jgi:hypothetical protein
LSDENKIHDEYKENTEAKTVSSTTEPLFTTDYLLYVNGKKSENILPVKLFLLITVGQKQNFCSIPGTQFFLRSHPDHLHG